MFGLRLAHRFQRDTPVEGDQAQVMGYGEAEEIQVRQMPFSSMRLRMNSGVRTEPRPGSSGMPDLSSVAGVVARA